MSQVQKHPNYYLNTLVKTFDVPKDLAEKIIGILKERNKLELIEELDYVVFKKFGSEECDRDYIDIEPITNNIVITRRTMYAVQDGPECWRESGYCYTCEEDLGLAIERKHSDRVYPGYLALIVWVPPKQ